MFFLSVFLYKLYHVLCLLKLPKSYRRLLEKKKRQYKAVTSCCFGQTKTSFDMTGNNDHFAGVSLPLVVNSLFKVNKSPKMDPLHQIGVRYLNFLAVFKNKFPE